MKHLNLKSFFMSKIVIAVLAILMATATCEAKDEYARSFGGRLRYYPGTNVPIKKKDYRLGQAYSETPVVPVYVVPAYGFYGQPVLRAPKPNPNYYKLNNRRVIDCK